MLLLVLFTLIVNEIDNVLFGMAFLELEPKHFECQETEHYTDSEGHDVATETWRDCSKSEICEKGYDHDHYRAVHDDEYLDNWVDKLELLCESKLKIGLIGSLYFAGVITTLLFVPPLSDRFGRKVIFVISLFVSLFAQAGYMWSQSLYETYVY